MAREAVPTWFFALVVVRAGERFLVVRERKHGQGWYLPAGRVEPGERIEAGALREVLEETGVPVTLTGILRVEHTPTPTHTRVRVFFTARPVDARAPKATPDEHSLEARYVTIEELEALPLRGEEVAEIFAAVRAGAPVYPLALLTDERAPWG